MQIQNKSIRKLLQAGKQINLTNIFIDTAIEEIEKYIIELEQKIKEMKNEK